MSLPKLSKAYWRAGCGFAAFDCEAYTVTKGEITSSFYARENAARILRPVRVNFDLRKSSRADGNAFPCRCVRSSRAASAEETVFSRLRLPWFHIADV